MGFTRLSAPPTARADVARDIASGTDRFTIMSVVRAAAPLLGLRAPVLATLDAMLSCLPPQRQHHIVFAANATLLARIGGSCDRTLRRHAATLIRTGLIRRQDSANGKRFARRAGGEMAAFGFDLAPLFARQPELNALAAEARAQAARIGLLQSRLRAAIHARLAGDPADSAALAALPLLRRKVSEAVLSALCDDLAAASALPCDATRESEAMTANDGQNVRHHQKSETELNDKEPEKLSVPVLLAACPEPASFAPEQITGPDQVLHHARQLAPMIGIDRQSYDRAELAQGANATALTIWLIVQLGRRVRSAGAYFRAVTTGTRSVDFDPAEVILRMARRLSADNPCSAVA